MPLDITRSYIRHSLQRVSKQPLHAKRGCGTKTQDSKEGMNIYTVMTVKYIVTGNSQNRNAKTGKYVYNTHIYPAAVAKEHTERAEKALPHNGNYRFMAPQRLFHDTEKAVRDIRTAFFAALNKAPEHTGKCICLYYSVLSHISKTRVFAAAHHPHRLQTSI